LALARLRKMVHAVEREARKMTELQMVLENEVLGREYRRGEAKGRKEGLARGVARGLARGEARGLARGRHEILRKLLTKRFGPLPEWAEEQLSTLTAAQCDRLAVRVLDAKSLESLLR
jgi:flagellar biosynthesis/type III secretory pathway protein FliH